MVKQTHISENLPEIPEQHKTSQSNFSEIELTPDEERSTIEAALHLAKVKKHAQIKQKAYWDKVKKLDEQKIFTANEFLAKIKRRANEVFGINSDGKCKFVLDEFNSDVFNSLFKYFHNDPSGPLDLSKGICLQGTYGQGKTKLMELFKFNTRGSFIIKPANELAFSYQRDGAKAIDKYSDPIPTLSFKTEAYGQDFFELCIDDVGIETEQKHFGSSSNVVADLIMMRYAHGSLKGKTHITTNLNGDGVEEMYGPRVRSRFREMFNTVTMPNGPDRRS